LKAAAEKGDSAPIHMGAANTPNTFVIQSAKAAFIHEGCFCGGEKLKETCVS
jgi:hypothetical protein